MVRGRIKRGERRIDAAIDHLAPYGFPRSRIRKAVNDLLQIYGRDGWVFLEEGQYRVVLDTLLEEQEKEEPPRDQQHEAAAAEEASRENDMQVSPENHMQLSGEKNVEQINEPHSSLQPQVSHDSEPSFEPVMSLPEPELEAAAVEEASPQNDVQVSPENHMQLSGEQNVEPINEYQLPLQPPLAPHGSSPSFQPSLPPGFEKKPVMPLSRVRNMGHSQLVLQPQASHRSPSFQPAVPPGFEKKPAMPLSKVQSVGQAQLALQPQASQQSSPSFQPPIPSGFEKKPAMPLSRVQVGQAQLALQPQASHQSSPSFQPAIPPGFEKKPAMPLSRVQSVGQAHLALQPQTSHQSLPLSESVMGRPQAEPAVPALQEARCKWPPCHGWISESDESDPENEPKDAEIPPRMPRPKEVVPFRRKRPSRWDVRPN